MPAGRLGQMMALAAIAMIAAAGLCLFDADHAAGDLCLAFLTTALGLVGAFPLVATDRLLLARAKAYRLYPRDLPAPPPKA